MQVAAVVAVVLCALAASVSSAQVLRAITSDLLTSCRSSCCFGTGAASSDSN